MTPLSTASLSPLIEARRKNRLLSVSHNNVSRVRIMTAAPTREVELGRVFEVLKTVEKASGHAVSKKYTGPQLPKDFLNVSSRANCSDNSSPSYVDGDGRLYDTFYRRCEQSEAGRLVQRLARLPFPSPDAEGAYIDFNSYEAAVLEWKKQVTTALGHLTLPQLMGRAYPRPRVFKMEEEFDVDDEMTDLDSLPSFSFDEKISSSLSKSGTFDKKPAPGPQPPDKPGAPDEDIGQFGGFERQGNIWDLQLIPHEPVPELYATLPEFEAAYKRWAQVVADLLVVIPPHPSQLSQLLSLATAVKTAEMKKVRQLSYSVAMADEDSEKPTLRVNVIKVENATEDPLYSTFIYNPHPPPEPPETTEKKAEKTVSRDNWIQLPDSTRKQVTKRVGHLVQTRLSNQRKYKAYNAPMLPIVHGTFAAPKKQFDDYSFSGPVIPRMKRETEKVYEFRALRRTDLSPEELASCMDCPAMVGDKPVGFTLPVDEIGPINFQRLNTDYSYKEQWLKQLRTFQAPVRNQHLYSWYWPKVDESVHAMHRSELDLIVAHRETMPPEVFIRRMLTTPIYFDRFEDLITMHTSAEEECAEELSFGEGKVTYLQLLLQSVDPESFSKEVLPLFQDSNSDLVHAKLAFFVAQVMQSNKAKAVLGSIFSTNDRAGVYHLAHAMTFFNEVSVALWPYRATTMESVLGPKEDERRRTFVEPLFDAFFLHYYLKATFATVSNQKFTYLAIFKRLGKTIKRARETLEQLLVQRNYEFLHTDIVNGIQSQSSRLSAVWLFVWVQLMRHESAGVRRAVAADEAQLLPSLRDLSRSKVAHIRYAVIRIFDILMSEDWTPVLYSYYTRNETALFEDLTEPSEFARAQMERRPWISKGEFTPSLISLLTGQMCKRATQGARAAKGPTHTILLKYAFVLKGSLFKRLLAFASEMPETQTVELVTELLAELSVTLLHLGLISGSTRSRAERVSITGDPLSGHGLVLNPPELTAVIAFITSRPGSTSAPLKLSKANMLRCLHALLQPASMYTLVKREKTFWAKLVQLCRDGSDMGICKAAWKVVYTTIKHHPGTVEVLIANKCLEQLLDCISTGADNSTIINGLHYLAKIFLLEVNDSRRKAKGLKVPLREDPRTLDKDLKLLVGFYLERTAFIKVHMIYKQFGDEYPGAKFHQLAYFYNTIATCSACASILKFASKNEDYLQGVQKMKSFFEHKAVSRTERPH